MPSLHEPFRTFAYKVVDRLVLLLAEGAGLADQVRFVFIEVIVEACPVRICVAILKSGRLSFPRSFI